MTLSKEIKSTLKQIATKLKVEGLNKKNVTKAKAIQVTINTVNSRYIHLMIMNFFTDIKKLM